MSRNIMGHTKSAIFENFGDKEGKLLFTRYHNRDCAMLLREGRLFAVRTLSQTGKIDAIYVGRIKNAVKNINAYFVEIEDGEIAFLPAQEAKTAILLNRAPSGRLVEGDEIIVQVTKDAQKTKQASVTTAMNLSNEFAALSISGHASSKIVFSGKLGSERRRELKGWLREAGLCDEEGRLAAASMEDTTFTETKAFVKSIIQNMNSGSLSLVVRTQAADCEREQFLAACGALMEELAALISRARHTPCHTCLKAAPSMAVSILDKMVSPEEYGEIVTDIGDIYTQLDSYCREHLPGKSVRLYQDGSFSLSQLYSLEHKMKEALGKRVWLESGAYLVIEATEAMTVIDVNSGKCEAKKASEETYARINREAAVEIARQLRLRNLSGIIVVDFINMDSGGQELVNFLQKLVKSDKMKTNVVDITPLGLVEITRKKGYKPLREQFSEEMA